MNKRIIVLVTIISLIVSVSLASATPPSGVFGEVLSDVAAEQPLELKVEGINFEPETPFRIRTRRITIAPGGYGGWHSHSGPVMVSVLEGEYTFYDASDPECGSETLTAGEDKFNGQGWIKPGIGVHVPVNESADEDLVFIAVFFYPEGEPIRIDQDKPAHCQDVPVP